MEERIVKPFTMWRHFKGARAFVITVAEHSETGGKLVVYRCMDNDGNTKVYKTAYDPRIAPETQEDTLAPIISAIGMSLQNTLKIT